MYKKQSHGLFDFNILTGEFDSFDFSNPKICHGGKGGGGTNTVTQNSAPPPQVMQAYQTALNAGQSAASQPLQQYGGPTIAGFTPDQLSAFGTINSAQGVSQPYIDQAQGLIQQGTQPLWSGVQQFSPENVQQYMNPYTKNVLDASVAQQQNTDAQQQSALKGNAISSGAWGGDRAGVASAILSGQQDLANNATNANILNTGYNSGLGEFNTQQQAQLGANEANSYLNQQGAFGLANLGQQAMGSKLTGASAQLQSGGLQQQLGQEALNVPYQQFLQQQAYPFQGAQYFANIAEGLGGGAGGTSSTTSPGASTLSQIGGLGLGGLGLAGSLGAFSGGAGAGAGLLSGLTAATSDAGVGSALAAIPFMFKKGGRIKGYDNGGIVLPGVPDVSLSFIPNAKTGQPGAGPPKAPQPYQNQDPIAQAKQGVDMMNFVGGLGKESQGFDDGGMVGGQAPVTAQTSSQQNPTTSSNLNTLTPEQLQQMIMRLPAGSEQAKSATAVLQQKRMMPNVGAPAQGGFGSQPVQEPMFGGYAKGGRAHYDVGGDIPGPPDQGQLEREAQMQSEMDQDQAGNLASTIPDSALQPASGISLSGPPPEEKPVTGGMGTKRMTASAAPPMGSEATPHTTRREVNPWLALAQAGFAMAGGTSPYAGVNLGRGAMAGTDNLMTQQKEADTVDQSADRLMQEAKQHRDQIAIEQQNADTNKEYKDAMVHQGHIKVMPDGMGGFIQYDERNPSSIKTIPGAGLANEPNSPTAGLTGKPFLDALAKKDPAMAAQVKAMDEGDLNFPTGFAAKAPYWQQRLNALYQYHPEASQQTSAAYKQFMSGPLGNTTRSLSVATNHIELANQLIDALNNGDTKKVNALGNRLQTELGLSDAPTNLEAVKQVMAGEIVKASTGAGGALGDRDTIGHTIDIANSPALLKGALKTYQGLMGGQFKGIKRQYEQQTTRKDFDRFLEPTALEAMGATSGENAVPPAGQRVVGQTYPTPKGPLVWQEGGWAKPAGAP